MSLASRVIHVGADDALLRHHLNVATPRFPR